MTGTQSRSGRAATLAVALVLAALTLAVYARTRGYGFISFDDPEYVYQNPHVLGGLSLEGLKYAFGNHKIAYWHPLSVLSHMADVEFLGTDPGRHHLSSMAWHLANVLLLWLALWRLTGAKIRSAFVAALFAVHPVNVDSVAWIAERKNLVSTFFGFLALLAWAGYARKPGFLRYFLVFAAMALGLLAKPMLMTLPVLLLLLDVWPLGRVRGLAAAGGLPAEAQKSAGFLLAEKLPLLALSAASAIATLVTGNQILGIPEEAKHGLWLRLANAAVAYAQYLGDLVFPRDLAVVYPYPPDPALWQWLGAGLLIVLLLAASVRAFSRRPYLLVGLLWFFIALSPVIGVVELGGLLIARADRFAYVPGVGLFVAAVWGISGLVPQRRWRLAAVLGLAPVLILAVLACFQAGYWKDSETLYRHALAVTENNWTIHADLGAELLEKGRTREALKELQAAWKIRRDYDQTAVNLGNARLKLGDPLSALSWYETAARLRPDRARTWDVMGVALYRLERTGEALKAFKKAVELDPEDSMAASNLGMVLVREGFPEQALPWFRRAAAAFGAGEEAGKNADRLEKSLAGLTETAEGLKQELSKTPDDAMAWNNLGITLFRMGRTGAARQALGRALELSAQNDRIRANLAAADARMEIFSIVENLFPADPLSEDAP